jgi:hypothetical protein
MSEPMDIEEMIAAAGQAVGNGDLAAADILLRDAAQDQESRFGPLHPALATTLNNRAIVAEKIGRQKDAEMFYRRAAAIASASLPPGDPMVAETRQNLEDFCRARGLAIDSAVVKMRPAAASPRPAPRAAASRVAAPERAKAAVVPAPVRALPDSPVRTPRVPARAEVPPVPVPATISAPPPTSRAGLWAAIAVVLVLVAMVLVMRPRSPQSTAPPAAESVRPPSAEPTRSAPVDAAPVAAPREHVQAPAPPPRDEHRAAVPDQPGRAVSTGAINVTHAELCRTLSTRRGPWQCKPAGDVIAPGPLVFYTRLSVPRSASITHRWYRGETSRQTVRLTIHPNGTAGYRTYSRQTVTPGQWRVEVRSSAGDLLDEKRFTVK